MKSKLVRTMLIASITAIYIAVPTSANAAVITYIGHADSIGPAASVVYGTDGYDLYGTSPVGTTTGATYVGAGTRLTKLPSYVNAISFGNNYLNGEGYLYPTIDNPAGGQVEAGNVSVQSGNPGVELDLLTVSFNGSIPADFNLGVILDGLESENHLRLRQSAGGSGDTGLVPVTEASGINEFFFKVSAAKAGDAVTLSGMDTMVNPSNPIYIVSANGVTFTQNAVPEPTTASLMIIAVGGLLTGRQRKA